MFDRLIDRLQLQLLLANVSLSPGHAAAVAGARHTRRPAQEHVQRRQVLAALATRGHLVAGHCPADRVSHLSLPVLGLVRLASHSPTRHARHWYNNFYIIYN